MELDYFKDKIFDLLNETDTMIISDIEAKDKENIFRICLEDGKIFEVECRQVK